MKGGPRPKTLLLLRHGKSEREEPGAGDHDRPLTESGRADARRIGLLLAREGPVPDRILCSTALRARDTAERAARGAGVAGPILPEPRLYLADPAGLAAALREVPEPAGVVMLVGHNPGLEDLMQALTGRRVPLPPAALARIDLPLGRWADLAARTRGVLAGVRTPRDAV